MLIPKKDTVNAIANCITNLNIKCHHEGPEEKKKRHY